MNTLEFPRKNGETQTFGNNTVEQSGRCNGASVALARINTTNNLAVAFQRRMLMHAHRHRVIRAHYEAVCNDNTHRQGARYR